jgi:hypothetical protein
MNGLWIAIAALVAGAVGIIYIGWSRHQTRAKEIGFQRRQPKAAAEAVELKKKQLPTQKKQPNAGTVIIADRPVEIPPNTAVFLLDEGPLPTLGQRTGKEYDSLIVNLTGFCQARVHGAKLNILQKNPALRLLKDNDPLFQLLCAAYKAGGPAKLKASFEAVNSSAAEIVIRISKPNQTLPLCSEEEESFIRQEGVAANNRGGFQAMQALACHVRTLGDLHLGNRGAETILNQRWSGIGDWR